MLEAKIKDLPDMVLKGTLEPGAHIAENIMHKDAPTYEELIVAKEKTVVAVCSHRAYKLVYKKVVEKRRRNLAEYLRQTSFMHHWEYQRLLKVQNMMTLEKVKNPGTVILPEGKVPKFFIMVKEGQFELSRRNLDSIYMNTETG